MPPHRYPGPICQTQDWYELVEDGTLARTTSPLPPPVGSTAAQGIAKTPAKVVASGDCSFVNPRAAGTVTASPAAFDQLRLTSAAAKISPAKPKSTQTWPDKSTSAAIEQEIEIGSQKIGLVRATDADAKGKNLPTTQQVAEALRAIPAAQRAHSTKVLLSPTPAPGSTQSQLIAGQGGSGGIELFPVSTAQSQNDFDNRLMHESGHNSQEKLWSNSSDVGQWQMAANADNRRPSPYAANNAGDDFCEFNILYNTAKGTPCEATAKQIYPNRWKKMEGYPSP